MSNCVEIVQTLYGAFGRGDVAAVLALLSDDVQWEHKGELGLKYMGRFVGKAAVAQWFGAVAQTESIQRFEPREFFGAPDHVTVLGWERTQVLPAGGVFETDWIHFFQLHDGRIIRFIGTYDTAVVAAAHR